MTDPQRPIRSASESCCAGQYDCLIDHPSCEAHAVANNVPVGVEVLRVPNDRFERCANLQHSASCDNLFASGPHEEHDRRLFLPSDLTGGPFRASAPAYVAAEDAREYGVVYGSESRRPTLEDDSAMCVRVLTYNVNWGLCRMGMGTPRDHRILKAIETSRADIVCLQETQVGWQTFLQSRLLPTYPHMVWHHHQIPDAKVNSVDGSHAGGLAVLSRYPLKVVWCERAPVAGAFFPSLLAEVDFGDGALLQLLNVHLRPPISDCHKPSLRALFNTSGVRKAEIQYYCERMRTDLPTVICGDFNEGHDGDGLVWLKRGYGGAAHVGESSQSSPRSSVHSGGAHSATPSGSHSDAHSTSHSPAGSMHAHDGPAQPPRRMTDALEEFDASSKTWSWPLKFGLCLRGTYDHILYSPDTMSAVSCSVLKEYENMSDHVPVVADLRMRPAR